VFALDEDEGGVRVRHEDRPMGSLPKWRRTRRRLRRGRLLVQRSRLGHGRPRLHERWSIDAPLQRDRPDLGD
jgi:hypothetical protein